MNALQVANVAVSLAVAGLLAWVWVYMLRLEQIGCTCAMDYRRTYIMAFVFVRIVVLLLSLAGVAVPALAVVMIPADVLFVTFALQYVHDLKAQKCSCSEDVARDVLQIVAVIDAVLMAILVGLVAVTATSLSGGWVTVRGWGGGAGGDGAAGAAAASRQRRA